MKTRFVILFLAISTSLVGQHQALKYPAWVYNPPEKKDMVSAIAFDFGSTLSNAMENAQIKARKQLFLLLHNTFQVLTTPNDSASENVSELCEIRNLLQSKLTQENIETRIRETYVEQESEQFRAIILIDSPIEKLEHIIKQCLTEYECNRKNTKSDEIIKRIRDKTKRLRKYIIEANTFTPILEK